MFCNKCGTKLPDEASYCHRCGGKITISQSGNEKTIEMIDSIIEKLSKPALPKAEKKPQYGMLWYDFLIYFIMFIDAGAYLITGVVCALGLQYGDMTNEVYELFPDLYILDILFGALFFIFAIYSLIVRNALKKKWVIAPGMLYSTYVINCVLMAAYYLLSMHIIDEKLTEVEVNGIHYIPFLWGIVIGSGFMLAVNFIYFRKRQELFVN